MMKGCKAYLAYAVDMKKKSMKLFDIPVVMEFPDLFPDEQLGLLSRQEIEVSIEIMPRMTPISQALYRIAPIDLVELKFQL